jgi:hypothetical protein
MPFNPNEPTDEDELLSQDEADGEELSYAELLASAVLNGEIVITIPLEQEERVKNGLKNYTRASRLLNRKKRASQSTLLLLSSLQSQAKNSQAALT